MITFEELQALFDSKDIDIENLESTPIDDATPFGRGFAKSGGVAAAVVEALIEQGSDFVPDTVAVERLDKCKPVLMRASRGMLKNNLIEGMACANGCIGGAGCLSHTDKHKVVIDQHAREATHKEITKVVEGFSK